MILVPTMTMRIRIVFAALMALATVGCLLPGECAAAVRDILRRAITR